jgi:hypothetical protein
MNKSQQLFIEVIAHSIFNKPISSESNNLSDINLSDLFELADQHSMSGMLFAEMQKLYSATALSSVIEKQTKELLSTHIISAQQDYAFKELSNALSNVKIDHMPLKGIYAKRLYPSPELRTMGDLDILVKLPHDENSSSDKLFDLLDRVIFDLGYRKYFFADKVHCYHRDRIHLEMHFDINSELPITQVPVIDMTKLIWDNSDTDTNDDYLYTLSPQYEFVFSLFHLLKHLSSLGCGIRMILDMAVICNHFKYELDTEMIRELIENQGLTLVCSYVFALIEKWFGVSCPVATADARFVKEDVLSELEIYTLNHGSFGLIDRNTYSIVFRNAERSFGSVLKNWLQFIFPSAKNLSVHYPILKQKKFLLPFYWIVRYYKLIISKNRSSVVLLKKIISAQKPAEEESKFLKKIGL